MNKVMAHISDASDGARSGRKGGANFGHYGIDVATSTNDGPVEVRVSYRGTVVVQFIGNFARLATGGWQTKTTKEVINAALWSTGYRVFQRKFEWFVDRGNGTPEIPFVDGMLMPIH